MAELIGVLGRDTEGFRAVFNLALHHDRTTVWRAISDQRALAKWLGRFSHELAGNASFSVDFLNDTDYQIRGTVRQHQPLHTLEYDWTFGNYRTCRVRFDLAAGLGSGTTLRLTVSGLDSSDVVHAAATWHAQLELLRLYLAGEIVPAYALRYRRDELLGTYAAQVHAIGGKPENASAAKSSEPSRPNELAAVLHAHAHLA